MNATQTSFINKLTIWRSSTGKMSKAGRESLIAAAAAHIDADDEALVAKALKDRLREWITGLWHTVYTSHYGFGAWAQTATQVFQSFIRFPIAIVVGAIAELLGRSLKGVAILLRPTNTQ